MEESTNLDKIMKVLNSVEESVEECPVCHKVPCECKKEEELKEDFQKVDIETDTQKMSMESDENGRVTVTTEPKEETVAEASDEVIAPVSDEVKEIIDSNKPEEEEEMAEEPEYTDVDFDEFEESDFDELGESYLKRVYENVKSFKTTKGSIQDNQLKLEGLIEFKSGKQAKTNFIFEAYQATKTGKLKFIGENKQFAKGKKSFILSGRNDNKKLVNTIQKVLVEGYSNKEDELFGYTETNKLVNFTGKKEDIGKIVNVKILDAKSFSLDGVEIE